MVLLSHEVSVHVTYCEEETYDVVVILCCIITCLCYA